MRRAGGQEEREEGVKGGGVWGYDGEERDRWDRRRRAIEEG